MIRQFLKKILPASLRLELRKIFLSVRGWYFRGNKYYCPCCEKRYRTFLAIREGASNRDNVVCPGCAVVERHRLLKLYLKAKTDIYSRPHQVLYFAPELSIQEHLKRQPNIKYLSTDIDSALAMQEFDIMDIPHPDKSFSIIFCSHVLAHVRDDQKALKELFRILKKDGTLIMLDLPSDNPKTLEFENVKTEEERVKAYGQNDRWRLYGQDFVERIERIGFHVTVENFAEELSNEIIETSRISKRDKIYLCKK